MADRIVRLLGFTREKAVGFLVCASCFFLIILVSACDNGHEADSSSNSGSISFGIALQDEPSMQRSILAADELDEDCEEAGVETVRVKVYDEAGSCLTEGSWPCSARNGTLQNVSEGSDRKIVILCEGSNQNVRYRGEYSGITVIQGQTTDIGSVEACFFIPMQLAPADGLSFPPDDVIIQWGAVEGAQAYRILISESSDLSEPVIDKTTIETTFHPQDLSDSTIYHWQVHSLDSNGNKGAASETHWFTTNRPPVLDPIGNRGVEEGGLLQFAISATDPDGDELTYSAGNLPSGAEFDSETRTFSWSPEYGRAGNYDVLFTVTDNGNSSLSDFEEVTITVGDVNRPPVLDHIGSRSVEEGESLQFAISATDPDGNQLTYSAGNLPNGAEFDSVTRTFTWHPGYGQAGNYDVLFTVTDAGDPSESDSEEVTITVGHVNRPPVLDPIGNRSVEESELLQFAISASDPDGDELTYSAGNLPIGARFDSATRTFTWSPAYGQAGNHNVLFTVTDNGDPSLTDSEQVTITVGDVNRPPMLDPIGNRGVEEGESFQFAISASDPDGNQLTYSAGNLPIGARFDSATRTFTWIPAYGQAGNYNVLFTVTDDGDSSLTDSEEVTITVGNVNRPPVLDLIGSRSVEEGASLQFTISASDPDGDELTYSASNLPIGAGFDSVTHTFTWSPAYGQAGNYNVLFTVTDNGDPGLTDSEEVTITVGQVNRPPVLEPIGSRSVEEGESLEFAISASDPDGDELTYSAGNLPIGAVFDSATQTFTWSPDHGQAGNYDVLFRVTDNGNPSLTDSEEVTITVGQVNRPPVLDPIGSRGVEEGELLQFTISASDPDGDELTYSASNLPSGAEFDSATQTFTWRPDYGEAGNYNVLFRVTDNGDPSLSDSEEVTITVGQVNRPPVLEPIGSRSIEEGESLEFAISATDPDGDELTYSASNLPSGAEFDSETRTFTWTPAYGQAGNYDVLFRVTDNGDPSLTDSEEVTITVGQVNRPPALDPIGSRGVEEGESLEFAISASDPDGDELTYSASNLPIGAVFDSATQTFTWSPDHGQAGNYDVLFTVTDDGDPSLTDSEEVTITVGQVNRPPVLDPIGSRGVEEGELLQFTISASDPDGDELTYSAGNLPIGAEFDSATQTFTWRPDYGEAGNYNVLFRVTDNGDPSLTDSEEVTITVGQVNRPPVLDTIGSRSVEEGESLEFTINASDPDGDELTYSADHLPSGAEFDSENRTFTWTPAYGQAGNYDVLFRVTDNGDPSLTDSEEVTITVGHVNRPPVLDHIGSRSVEEGESLEFAISASDPDGDELTYSAGNLPSGAEFDSETRTFTWTPAYGQAGNYDVLFTVTDDGDPSLTDSEEVTITVGQVNRPPVLDTIGSRSVEEGESLEFAVSASDPDGDELTYSADHLPSGAEFDSETRTFTWIPDYGQADNYDVLFTVTDDGDPVLTDSEEVTITVTANFASVSGTVVDAVTGYPIGGASVSISGSAYENSVTTEDDGQYGFPDVPEGDYTIFVSVDGTGYIPEERSITVAGGSPVVENFALTEPPDQYRIVLTWGEDPRDLDSHLWTPDIEGTAYHIYYPENNRGSESSPPYVELDVDDTTSYGPETITIYDTYPGTYTYAVHHYAGDGSLTTSGAEVRLYGPSGMIQEWHVPSEGSGMLWTVFRLDGDTGEITTVDTISD